MSLYAASVPQLLKMLQNLDRCLEKAEAYAKAKPFDVNVLLEARLAPDQYPLLRQVQIAADNAKFIAARLTGKAPPKHPDTEKTWEEARARIASVRQYLETFSEKDFEGAKDRLVELPFLPGRAFRASDYLNQFGLPNFYFHAVTAYAILRHNGVDLGKTDFMGGIPEDAAR